MTIKRLEGDLIVAVIAFTFFQGGSRASERFATLADCQSEFRYASATASQPRTSTQASVLDSEANYRGSRAYCPEYAADDPSTPWGHPAAG